VLRNQVENYCFYSTWAGIAWW